MIRIIKSHIMSERQKKKACWWHLGHDLEMFTLWALISDIIISQCEFGIF
jgi:hypothetical protein